MTESEFVATVWNGIEAYVCNETKLFKSNQGDYDFAQAVVDHLILNGNLPLEEFIAANGLRREEVMKELNEKIRELESSLNRYRVHADLTRGILHAQALSTMDGSPAPVLRWKSSGFTWKASVFGMKFEVRKLSGDLYYLMDHGTPMFPPYNTLDEAKDMWQAYWQQLWDKEMLISRDLPETGE